MTPLRLFTKTRWNAQEIQHHTGATPVCVGPSFAWQRFIPGERPRNVTPVEVVAMVRPSTPRRSPELTVRVLEQLTSLYGSGVRIHVFGVDPSHSLLQNLARSGRCLLHGEVTTHRVSEILREADIFLDFSIYQAMGLTALEAMASGVAVVGPRRGGLAEFLEHEVSGLLVDTRDEMQCLQAARRLIDDWEFRDGLIRKGLEVAAHCYPEQAALALMETLFPGESARR
jgi:glycosyltransferase involved in cell wall biosynthesis